MFLHVYFSCIKWHSNRQRLWLNTRLWAFSYIHKYFPRSFSNCSVSHCMDDLNSLFHLSNVRQLFYFHISYCPYLLSIRMHKYKYTLSSLWLNSQVDLWVKGHAYFKAFDLYKLRETICFGNQISTNTISYFAKHNAFFFLQLWKAHPLYPSGQRHPFHQCFP